MPLNFQHVSLGKGTTQGYTHVLVPVRELAAWIESNILLDLSKASFSKVDETILPEAGSCAHCPKRTGFIRLLFRFATCTFRSFRTMHSSLMSSIGVRPEVTGQHGHAIVDVTQNGYNRTWWEERVDAVSMAAATVWREFLTQPVPAKRM